MMLNYTEMMREDLERQSAALREIVAFVDGRKGLEFWNYGYSDLTHIKRVAADALKGGA